MFTLFITGTLLDDIYPLTQGHWQSSPGGSFTGDDDNFGFRTNSHWVMLLVFLFYLLVSNFTVLNMLIGILCEVITGTTKKEAEKALVSLIEEEIWDIFHNAIDV